MSHFIILISCHEYVRSLINRPIEYYTCFISYSSKDELFAKRLHNDLQQEGVRCWFTPEDMEVGDMIKHRIDESIRSHDKVLLILTMGKITPPTPGDIGHRPILIG
jgi:TIR domain